MDTNVLTIQNLLSLNPVAGSAVQKPSENQNNSSFESSLNQIQSKPENAQQTTTDNNTTQNTQTNPDNQPQQTAPAQTQETNPENAQQPAQNTKKPDKNNQNSNPAENQIGTTEDQTNQSPPQGLNIALANVIAIATEKPVLQAKATIVLTEPAENSDLPAELTTTAEKTINPVNPTPLPAAQKTIIEPLTTTPNNQTGQTTPNENQAVQDQSTQQTQILDNQLTSPKNPDTQPAEPQTNQPQTTPEQQQPTNNQPAEPQTNQPQTTPEQQQPTNNQPANILSSYTIANIAVENKPAQLQSANTQQPMPEQTAPEQPAPEQTEPENNQPNQKDNPSQTIPEAAQKQIDHTNDTAQKQIDHTSDTTPEQILSTDKNQSLPQNSQTQSQNNQSSKDNNPANNQQLITEPNVRFQSTEQLQTAEQTSKDNPTENTVLPVSRQVQESMQTSLQNGVKQITIQLNPPSLGRVSITFQETAGEITGRLIVSKAETRLEIEQSLPQIIQNLANSGINIKRVEVVLTSNSDQYSLKEQSLQEGTSQQNSFNNPQDGFQNDANQSWTNSSQYQYIYDNSPDNPYYPQETYITETSVNMLV